MDDTVSRKCPGIESDTYDEDGECSDNEGSSSDFEQSWGQTRGPARKVFLMGMDYEERQSIQTGYDGQGPVCINYGHRFGPVMTPNMLNHGQAGIKDMH